MSAARREPHGLRRSSGKQGIIADAGSVVKIVKHYLDIVRRLTICSDMQRPKMPRTVQSTGRKNTGDA